MVAWHIHLYQPCAHSLTHTLYAKHKRNHGMRTMPTKKTKQNTQVRGKKNESPAWQQCHVLLNLSLWGMLAHRLNAMIAHLPPLNALLCTVKNSPMSKRTATPTETKWLCSGFSLPFLVFSNKWNKDNQVTIRRTFDNHEKTTVVN